MKMQWIFFPALLTVGFSCSSGEPRSIQELSRTTTAQVSEPAVDGSRIYKSFCVACHGLYGDMGSVGAFDLTKTALTVEEKIEVITRGRNTMAPFEGLLTQEQIKAVAEYTETLKQ